MRSGFRVTALVVEVTAWALISLSAPAQAVSLQATCPDGVQEFGDGPPGMGVALFIRICAEASQQFHPGPCSLVFCDQRQKPVLVTDGQLRDMPGQRAGIAGRRGERRAGLGRDLRSGQVARLVT